MIEYKKKIKFTVLYITYHSFLTTKSVYLLRDLPNSIGNYLIMMIDRIECFFGLYHVTLDRNPGPGYNTLLIRFIPSRHGLGIGTPARRLIIR